VLSKRKLIRLVQEGHVAGWDDPRMPTLAGIRRRGIPPEALLGLCDQTGIQKSNSREELRKFEYIIRDTLNPVAPRVMAVLDPLKVVLTNYPQGEVEWLEAPLYPHDVPLEGTRRVPFGREVWIERDDFAEDPPPGFRRLVPGEEVRLRYGYVIRCHGVVKDDEGRVVEVHCSYDPETRGGDVPDGRTIRGTIQWVAAAEAVRAEVRLYDRLFDAPDPEEVPEGGDFLDHLNPESLVVVPEAVVEPWLAEADPEVRYQFERTGYFWRDPVDGRGERLVFNRIVSLKDTWGDRQKEERRKREEARRAEKERRRQAATPPADTGPNISEERARRREEDPALAGRFDRYVEDYGLPVEDADVLTGSRATADFFEAALEAHDDPEAVAAWMVNDLRGALGEEVGSLEELPFGGAALGRLARLVHEDRVSRRAAKDVLAAMVAEGGDPAEHIARLGLEKVSDEGELEPVVERVLGEWPGKVEEYRAGKKALLGLFVGEVMKATGGAADPKAVKALLEQRLEG
jgi:glutaminyl-tRNA synthetase